MDTQSETGQGVAKELIADAKGVGSTAVNRLHSEVDNRKGAAVTQVQSISSAIDRTAEGLDGNSPEWLKSAFTQGAQQVKKFADALEHKDSRQIVGDVSDFARKSPMTFLTACAAAGFAASRIFQAGAKDNLPSQPAPVGTDATGNGASQFASTGFIGEKSSTGLDSQPSGQSAAPAGSLFV